MVQPVNNSANEVSPPAGLSAFVDRLSALMPQLCQAMIRHEENYLASGRLNLP